MDSIATANQMHSTNSNENPSNSPTRPSHFAMDSSMKKRRLRKVVLVFLVIFVVGIFNVEYFIWNLQSHSDTEQRKESQDHQRYHANLKTKDLKKNQFQRGKGYALERHDGMTKGPQRTIVSHNLKRNDRPYIENEYDNLDDTNKRLSKQYIPTKSLTNYKQQNDKMSEIVNDPVNSIRVDTRYKSIETTKISNLHMASGTDATVITRSKQVNNTAVDSFGNRLKESLSEESIHAETNHQYLPKETIHREKVETTLSKEGIQGETYKESLLKETIEAPLPKEATQAATNKESLPKAIYGETRRTSVQTESINGETIKTFLSKEAIDEDTNTTNATVTVDNLNGRADIFKSRWKHVVEVCTAEGRPPPRDLAHSQYFPKMYLELPHTILYCPVEKVASTFWWKTLTAMNSMGYYRSPYEVRGKRYKVKTYYRHTQSTQNLNMDVFNKYGTSLLVVRDPYSKVFSAYVDKIYNPNVVFWNHIGKPIEKIIADKSDVNETKVCGHTATFAQYVKYLIYKFENEESLNTHFTSISSHCDPCVTKYDFISKLETFKDDVQAILAHWNKKFDLNIQFRHFEKETAIEIARIHINLALLTKTETEKQCSIHSDLFLLRTWRFLQISGIIPKEARFPDNWQDNWFIERPEYLMADVLNVIQGNISWPEVKSQRHEAMLQAYRTVPRVDMQKLREIVKADCKYFGYTDMPAELFNRSNTSLVSSGFDYFDAVK